MSRERSCGPPIRCRALVAAVLWGSRREVVMGDLEEAFHRRLASGTGAGEARRRYRREALASIWALLISGDLWREEPADASVATGIHEWPRTGQGDSPMAAAWNDFRFSTTSLVRRPGLALIVTFTLALGIGIGTTIFSVVESTLLAQVRVVRRAQQVGPLRLLRLTVPDHHQAFGIAHRQGPQQQVSSTATTPSRPPTRSRR